MNSCPPCPESCGRVPEEEITVLASPPWVAIGVPIDCVGRPGGTELSPGALRRSGILEALGADDGGDLEVRIDSSARDPESGIVGYASVCDSTRAIRRHLKEHFRQGRRVILLGGCCTQ